MRKTTVLVVSFMFLVSSNIQASPFAPSFNPYSFGPHGRSVADLRDFAKPKQMANILAGRPVVATKSDGTRVYYSSDGKLCLSIRKNGDMNFSLGGHSLNLDKNGKLKSETKTFKGNFQEVRDEFGDVTGYNQLDGNGKVVASYDEDMNKTTIYNYGKFGKSLEYSINLMNKQKTMYDSNERAMAVYDADGYILTSYQYEDVSYESAEDRKTLLTKENKDKGNRRLLSVRSYLNRVENEDLNSGDITYSMAFSTTFYDGEGLITYVVDADGITSDVYHYGQDTKGNKVLQYVLDTKTKNKTYYENNKQMYVENDVGSIITKYYWRGNKYLFSADVNKDGKWISTTNEKGLTTASNIVYNKDGQVNTISDEKGNIIEMYFYKKDVDGNNVLDYVENTNGNRTYFDKDENGKIYATKTVDTKGNILIDYGYNDSQKIYEFDRKTGVTKWYVDGEYVVYESLGDRIISNNIYSGGQLIGQWSVTHDANAKGDEVLPDIDIDGRSYVLTIFVNERQEFKLNLDKEPTVDLTRYIMNKFRETGSLKFLEDFGYSIVDGDSE